MTRYFVAGNVWLLVALVLFVGRTYERSSPSRYSVFNGGQWFSPEAYWLLIIAAAGVAIFFFVLMWRTGGNK